MVTGNQIPSLMEAYSAVYNDDLRLQLEEENQINEQIEAFLTLVDALMEEGYDLSDYTYGELYEACISENLLTDILKGGLGLLRGGGRALLAGAKPAIKGVLTKVGGAAVPVGIAAVIDQLMSGGKGREYAGAAFNAAREGLHNIPSPEKAGKSLSKLGQDAQNFMNMTPSSSGSSSSSGSGTPTPGNPLGLKKEDYDVYNIIAGYLINEGYVDDVDSAWTFIENMSEEWAQSIIEGVADRRLPPEKRAGARNRRAGFKVLNPNSPAATTARRREHKELRGIRGNIGGVGGSSYRYDSNVGSDYPSIRYRGREIS